MEHDSWKLWLDDQCCDPETPNRAPPVDGGFTHASTSGEAIAFTEVLAQRPPDFMDLDHDLGGDDTAMVYLKWLEEWTSINFPTYIPEYNVHSANPVGRDNIISYLESWRKSRS